MDDEILENIWNTLTKDGATKSDFETWKSNFSGSDEIQNNVHSYLTDKKYTKSDIETWRTNVGIKKKDQSNFSGGPNTGESTSEENSSDILESYKDINISRNILTIPETPNVIPQNEYNSNFKLPQEDINAAIQQNIEDHKKNPLWTEKIPVTFKVNGKNETFDQSYNNSQSSTGKAQWLQAKYYKNRQIYTAEKGDNGQFTFPTLDENYIVNKLREGLDEKNGLIKLPDGSTVFRDKKTYGEYDLDGPNEPLDVPNEYELALAIIQDNEANDSFQINMKSPDLQDIDYKYKYQSSSEINSDLLEYGANINKSQLNKEGINVQEFIDFTKKQYTKESMMYRFGKYGFSTNQLDDILLIEEKQLQKVIAFKTSKIQKLSGDLSLIEQQLKKTQDPDEYVRLRTKEQQYQTVLFRAINNLNNPELIKENFPNYYEHWDKRGDAQLKKRMRKYYVARDDNATAFGHLVGETAMAAAEGINNFTLPIFAAVPSFFDQALQVITPKNFESKGIFAGVTEQLLDVNRIVQQSEIGTTERDVFARGKEVSYQGELYLVTEDGRVLDEKTNVWMDGIISDKEIYEIKKASNNVKETSTNTTAGTFVPATASTIMHMFGLIRTGKRISTKTGFSPSMGMGLAAFTSSMANNVQGVQQDLMIAGMSETDAYDRAIIYGNAISTLDGIMSGLMGSNTKILKNNRSIKAQMLDFVLNKQNLKEFSTKELNRKLRGLTKEAVKEQIEELGVYAAEKGINTLINYDLGETVRSAEFKLGEIYEVSALTLAATSGLGANQLIKGNKRSDLVKFLSNDMKKARETLLKLEQENFISKENAAQSYGELYNMAAANNTVKGMVKVSENITPMAELLYRRKSLIDDKKSLEGPLKLEMDKKITDIDQQIQSLMDKDVADVDALIKEQNKEVSKETAINQIEKENIKREKDGLAPIELNKINIDKKINEIKDANKESSTVSETEGDTTQVVSEVDEGVSSDIPGTTTESSVETKANETTETTEKKITSSLNKNNTLSLVDGVISITNNKSGKTRKANRKEQADYIEQTQFKNEDYVPNENINENDYADEIINNSESPSQIAKLIENLENDFEADPDSEQPWKQKFRDYTVNKKSFDRFGDKNTLPKDKRSFKWITPTGLDLDIIAQEMSSDLGIDITTDMLVEEMKNNPTKKLPDASKKRKNPSKENAKKRFTELTGLEATDANINQVANKDPNQAPQDLQQEANNQEAFEKEENRKKEQYEDFDPAKDVISDSDRDSNNDNKEKPDTYFQRAKDYLNEQASIRYTQFVDKYSGVRKLQKAIENFTGKNQKDNSNFDKSEKVVYGKIRNKLEKFNKSMSNFLFKLNNKGISTKEFDDYLYAKHSLDRNKTVRERGSDNDDGSGMTDKEANDILKALQKKFGDKMSDLETAADFIYKTNRETLDMQLKSGLLSKKAYDNMLKNKWETYVPLMGFAENDPKKAKENKSGKPTGSGLQAGKSKTKMTGRKTKAQSPIASIMQRRTDAIMNIDKNNVLVKLFNMLKGNPDTNQYAFYNEGNRKKEMVRDPNTGNKIEVEMSPNDMRKDPGMVTVMVNGVENFIDFVADPSIGTILRTGLGVDAEQTNAVLKNSRKILNFMRKVYTTLSPEFVVTNYIRDIQTGVLNAIADKDIPLFSKNMAKTVTDLVMNSGKSFKTIRAVTLGKTQDADGNTLSDAELKKKGYNVEMVKYYDDFLAEGGQTGYGYTQSLDQIKKDVDAIENPTNFKKFSKSLNNVIDSFNNAAENSTRLSAYIMAKKDGMTNQEAAALAKDLTINFNQSGTQQYASALYLFFNASVQGTVRFGKAIGISNFQDTKAGEGNKILNAFGVKDKKLNPAQKLAGVLTSFSAMIAFANISFGDEDEDGVPYYDEIPESIKRRNIIIMRPGTGGKYIKIPLPYGYNIFHNIGTGTIDSAVGDKTAGEFATNLSVSALEAFSPVSLSDAKGVDGGIINSTPSALRPIVEVWANQNYFGQQIANEKFSDTDTTPDSQLGRYTTSSFKKISRFLTEVANEKSGGTVTSSGNFDFNPDNIDYLMQQYLGTLYTLPKLAADSYQEAISEKPYKFNPTKIPIVRRFFGEQNRFADQQSFYDRLVFLKGVDEQLKGIEAGKQKEKFSLDTYGSARGLLNASKKMKKILKKTRDNIKLIRNQDNMSRQDYIDIKMLEKAQDEIYDNFNKEFLQIFKRYSTPNNPVLENN